MDDTNLIKLQHFFSVDTRIKKEMYNNTPPSDNGYLDEKSLCQYTDNLEDSLKYMFTELKCISLDIFGKDDYILNKIEDLEVLVKNSFYLSGLDIDKLRNFYKSFITNMEPDFIDEVKKECVGYKMFQDLPIDKANTVNELLHLIHSYVLNNENILHRIPVVAQKTNEYGYEIVLRGSSNNTFSELFNGLPLDLDVGPTDMVCLDDEKLLMMVRDRGHALTIEITLNNDIARVEYFIPKLCNIDMINVLPGVNKVNEDSCGATGIFEVNKNDLSGSLIAFISKVPMDSDMVFNNKTI